MLGLFNKKVKRGVGIASLACFLCMPISYTVSVSTAAAASLGQQYEERHEPPGQRPDSDRNNRNDRHDNGDKDKRPPKNDRDDKWDKNDKRPAPPSNDDKWDKNDKRPAPPPNDDRWDKDDKRPAPPPRDDKNDRKDKKDDDDKDGYSKGNIVSAVLIGGVIGAIIAKNT